MIAFFGTCECRSVLSVQPAALVSTEGEGASKLTVGLAGAGVAVGLESLPGSVRLSAEFAIDAHGRRAVRRAVSAATAVATVASRELRSLRVALSLVGAGSARSARGRAATR